MAPFSPILNFSQSTGPADSPSHKMKPQCSLPRTRSHPSLQHGVGLAFNVLMVFDFDPFSSMLFSDHSHQECNRCLMVKMVLEDDFSPHVEDKRERG